MATAARFRRGALLRLHSAVASQLQGRIHIPQQFITLLPYVLTLIVLAVFAGRVRAPGAVGQPFVKGSGS